MEWENKANNFKSVYSKKNRPFLNLYFNSFKIWFFNLNILCSPNSLLSKNACIKSLNSFSNLRVSVGYLVFLFWFVWQTSNAEWFIIHNKMRNVYEEIKQFLFVSNFWPFESLSSHHIMKCVFQTGQKCIDQVSSDSVWCSPGSGYETPAVFQSTDTDFFGFWQLFPHPGSL